jgi:2-phospho-L-lactate guanylyltransferase
MGLARTGADKISPMETAVPGRRFGVIVPVKRPALGKSRLAPLGDEVRIDLVRAFAFDTVAAITESAAVGLTLVVTDDAALAAELSALGAAVIPDGGEGLNENLLQAVAELERRDSSLAPTVICADLPGLTSRDVDDVLTRAPHDTAAFVPDAAGTGTTIYLAPDRDSFDPRFGPGSARAHEESGAVVLPLPVGASARRDVDTPEDLEELRGTGAGAHTRMALTRHRI